MASWQRQSYATARSAVTRSAAVSFRAEATVAYGVLCKLDAALATNLYYPLGGR